MKNFRIFMMVADLVVRLVEAITKLVKKDVRKSQDKI